MLDFSSGSSDAPATTVMQAEPQATATEKAPRHVPPVPQAAPTAELPISRVCRLSGHMRDGKRQEVLFCAVTATLSARRNRGEMTEQQGTAQHAACQTIFYQAVTETSGARRESYRR
ncbi:TPA: hypothetical protein ACWZT8_004748 [Escherichia coli]